HYTVYKIYQRSRGRRNHGSGYLFTPQYYTIHFTYLLCYTWTLLSLKAVIIILFSYPNPDSFLLPARLRPSYELFHRPSPRNLVNLTFMDQRGTATARPRVSRAVYPPKCSMFSTIPRPRHPLTDSPNGSIYEFSIIPVCFHRIQSVRACKVRIVTG